MRNDAMIPVTVIGGFLGAGKTTLVNHLLLNATRRYAVLVNDFGAVNIDAGLIEARGDAVIALTNGCVCCSIGADLGADLGAALADLAARHPAPERVVIEASGVGDPWQVAQLCLVEPGFALDAIIVVADAAAFPDQLIDPYLADTVRRQMARADLVIVNKSDCADPPLRAAVAAAIALIRPEAAIVEAECGAIPGSWLDFAAEPHDAAAADHRGHEHGHPFCSWLWRDPRSFDRDRLAALLRQLPPAVLRVKGWCRVGPAGEWRLLNYAAGQWSLARSAPPPAADAALVLIGTAALPPPQVLAEMFDAALF